MSDLKIKQATIFIPGYGSDTGTLRKVTVGEEMGGLEFLGKVKEIRYAGEEGNNDWISIVCTNGKRLYSGMPYSITRF